MRLGRSLLYSGPREGSPHATLGHRGRHQGSQEGEDRSSGEVLDYGLYWGFHGKGKTGQNKQFRIG